LYKFLAGILMDVTAHPKITAAALVGLLSFSLAIWDIFSLRDSYHRELNYIEEL